MKFRGIVKTFAGIAASVLLATTAWAQTTSVSGIVQRVDVPGQTIYLTDGRAIVLQQNAMLTVAGREVSLAQVQPGWSLMTTATPAVATSPSAGPNTVIIVQPGVAAAPPAPPPVSLAPPPASAAITPLPAPAPPPIDATGVVAQVDPGSGTVTLADGRVLRVTSRTTIWQPVTVGSIVPGTSIYVRNAEPVAFQPRTQLRAVPSTLTYWMGTVRSVDPARSRVELTDGTVVRLRPGARLEFQRQPLGIADLRPGDEIVIGTPRNAQVMVVPPAPAVGSALPRQVIEEVPMVDADMLHIVQRVQVP
jgi:hypothetical protein